MDQLFCGSFSLGSKVVPEWFPQFLGHGGLEFR